MAPPDERCVPILPLLQKLQFGLYRSPKIIIGDFIFAINGDIYFLLTDDTLNIIRDLTF